MLATVRLHRITTMDRQCQLSTSQPAPFIGLNQNRGILNKNKLQSQQIILAFELSFIGILDFICDKVKQIIYTPLPLKDLNKCRVTPKDDNNSVDSCIKPLQRQWSSLHCSCHWDGHILYRQLQSTQHSYRCILQPKEEPTSGTCACYTPVIRVRMGQVPETQAQERGQSLKSKPFEEFNPACNFPQSLSRKPLKRSRTQIQSTEYPQASSICYCNNDSEIAQV